MLLENVNGDDTLMVCTDAEVEYCVELTMPAASVLQHCSVRSDPT